MERITKDAKLKDLKEFKILYLYTLNKEIILSNGDVIKHFYFYENDIRILIDNTSEDRSFFSFEIEDCKKIYKHIKHYESLSVN